MPTQIKNKRIARRPGKGAAKREDQKGSRRKGGHGSQAPAPKVISNSIFALTLANKPGVEIVEKLDGKVRRYFGDDNYRRMYGDLLECYHLAMRKNGTPTAYDPLQSGIEIGMALYSVIHSFREHIVPKDCDLNIDDNELDGYYFTIYKTVDFEEWWHAFEIKHIVKKLKHNKPLHDLFLCYIKTFMSHTGIMGWWDGGMGYADFMLEERIENWEFEYGDEFENEQELNNAKAALESYKTGEAYQYEQLIRKSRVLPLKKLQKAIEPYKRSGIGKLMMEGCTFLEQPGTINDFIYSEFEMEQGEGLRVDQQAAVIWDWDDAYTDMQEECLDAEAQGCGVIAPILNFSFNKHLKSFDKENFEKRAGWPKALTDFFSKHQDYVNAIKPKKKNAK